MRPLNVAFGVLGAPASTLAIANDEHGIAPTVAIIRSTRTMATSAYSMWSPTHPLSRLMCSVAARLAPTAAQNSVACFPSVPRSAPLSLPLLLLVSRPWAPLLAATDYLGRPRPPAPPRDAGTSAVVYPILAL
ncbi:hypothetical protein DENSPDRAFT_167232 [Dentipellis sp. KUC8613]|nr:hypothetical protein DENSPDRAFT_167232 [Dentipellis sp. KUC8613]